MNGYAIVSTKKELAVALKRQVDTILIANPDLAGNIKIIKSASNVALVAAIAATGVAATNFWNPVGWGAGIVGITTGGTITIALIALGLGATLIWAIYNNYDIKAGGKITLPDGTVIEGEIILEKK